MVILAPVILTPAPSIAIDKHWQGSGCSAGKWYRREKSGREASGSSVLGKQVTNQGGQAYTLVTLRLDSKLLPAFEASLRGLVSDETSGGRSV
jgi:hypothetical protein